MTEAEAVGLAIAWGIGLGWSINRQMVLQALATRCLPGGDLFSRVTQFVMSCTLLVGASLLGRGIEAVTFEGFMFLILSAASLVLWTQRTSRNRVVEPETETSGRR